MYVGPLSLFNENSWTSHAVGQLSRSEFISNIVLFWAISFYTTTAVFRRTYFETIAKLFLIFCFSKFLAFSVQVSNSGTVSVILPTSWRSRIGKYVHISQQFLKERACLVLQCCRPKKRCRFSRAKSRFRSRMRSYIQVQLNSSGILQCKGFVEANIGSNVNL